MPHPTHQYLSKGQQQQHGKAAQFRSFAPPDPFNIQQAPPGPASVGLSQNTKQSSNHSRQRILPAPLIERRRRRSLREIAGNTNLQMPTHLPRYRQVSFPDQRGPYDPRTQAVALEFPPLGFRNGLIPLELKSLLPPPPRALVVGKQHGTGHPEYELLKKVEGSGNMTRGVFKARHKRSGYVVILKRVEMGTRRSKAEITALWQLKQATIHPNVNFIIDYFVDERLNCYSLLLNECDRGTLENMIKSYKDKGRKTPPPFIYHTFLSLARALSYTHFGIVDPATSEVPITQPWNSICHLDIKPSNVFVKTDANGTKLPRIVLGDFGCAVSDWDVTTEAENAFVQSHGTPGWFPPENIGSAAAKEQGQEICYGLPTDIWQVGGVIQVMAKQCSKPDQLAACTEEPCGEGFDQELQKAVKACMNPNFRKRPGAVQMVKKITEVMQEKGYETYH